MGLNHVHPFKCSILIYTTTWINLQIIILRYRRQTKKEHILYMILLIKNSNESMVTKSISVVAWRWRETEWEGGITNGHKETFRAVGYVRVLIVVIVS